MAQTQLSEVPAFKLGTYRHYSGGEYFVIAVARNSTNGTGGGEWSVVYLSQMTGVFHYRALSEFTESVTWPDGFVRPRFVHETEAK